MNKRAFIQLVLASFCGSTLEWYDFAIYGVLAPILSPLFFPASNHVLSLLMAYTAFALGYLVRPIGGALFGALGDRYGRKSNLIITVLLMALPAFCIGLLPTYQTIGIMAPILLILLRLLQGLALGGELIGATTLLYESAPKKLQTFSSSLLWQSSGMGILIGSTLAGGSLHFFQHSHYPSLAWRTPFLLSLISAVIGYWLRKSVQESPEFVAYLKQKKAPSQINRKIKHKRPLALVILVFLFAPTATLFYIGFIFMPGILVKTTSLAASGILHANSLALLWMMLMAPCFALIYDALKKPWIWHKVALACIAIAIIPIYHYLQPQTLAEFLWLQTIVATLLAAFCGPLMAYTLSLSDVSHRYSTTAIGYNLSYALFGGTAPLIATALLHTQTPYVWLGSFICALCILAIIALNPSQQLLTEPTNQH
jgi:MFS transporter, MHS family, proline/betaine transporter